MPIELMHSAMGIVFLAIWFIVGQIIVSDHARRPKEPLRHAVRKT